MNQKLQLQLQLSRRQFLRGAVSGIVAAGLAGCGVRPQATPQNTPSPPPIVDVDLDPDPDPDEELIIAVLRDNLDYLVLDTAEILAFARDYLAQLDDGARREKMTLLADGFAQEVEALGSLFLLSTDFFQNQADVSQPVQYRALYDPYKGCSNPFAERRHVGGS